MKSSMIVHREVVHLLITRFRFGFLIFPLLFLSLCFLVGNISAQVVPRFTQRNFDALASRESFWIGSPNGLYQYRSAENVWSVRGKQNGLLSNAITRLGANGEELWIGQQNGLTIFNQQSNTMLSYDSARGIPRGKILSFAFEDDYVWVGTTSGAARYDRLIEEWQNIGSAQGLVGESVFEILPRGSSVFLITEKAINEYDPRYEKWRMYQSASGASSVHDAFATADRIWLFSDSGFVRFQFESKTFQRYLYGEVGAYRQIKSIFIDGETFWLLTDKGLWFYDPQADALRPFLEIVNLPDPHIQCASFSPDGKFIWFSTESGVSRFDRASKSWQYFTEASGMPAKNFITLFSYGNELHGYTPTQFVYFKPQENRWNTYPLHAMDTDATTTFSIDPAKGTFIDFGEAWKFSLGGSRSSWLLKTSQDEIHRFGETIETSKRNDLKARLDLGEARSMSGTYNDADFNDVMYGAQYRGARTDILQSAQVGDLRTEQGSKVLLHSFGLFGGSARGAFGERTETYRRSLLELNAYTGHKTTAIASDFFTGQSRIVLNKIRDVDFIRRTFYRLHSLHEDLRIEAGSLSLFVSRSANAPITKNILTDTVLAGISGTWMQLQVVKDFIVDETKGIIQLTQALPAKQHLVARYRRVGYSQEQTIVLATADSSAQEMMNVYSIRGNDIYPASLEVTIKRANGSSVPLAAVGLDTNDDSIVEQEFVDYHNGYLYFSFRYPFDVYRDSAVSKLTIHAQFETRGSGFALSHDRLVRGSEKIFVDGILARAGNDYILDYTSGYLQFVRDGAINEDSKIEIQYEYIRNRSEEIYSQATLTLSPDDHFQSAVSVAQFSPMNTAGKATLLHGFIEARLQNDDIDVRVVPEFAMSNQAGHRGESWNLFAAISSGSARLSVTARQQTETYVEPFIRYFSQGKLLGETSMSAEYDFTQTLRLFANWKRRDGTDTLTAVDCSDEAGSIGMQWAEDGLPSITVRVENLFDAKSDSTIHRRSIRGDIDYVPSSAMLQSVGISSASFTSHVRYAIADYNLPMGIQKSFSFMNVFLRSIISPKPLFTINSYYRGDVQQYQDVNAQFKPYLAFEKLFTDLLIEHLRGVSLSLRYSRELNSLHQRSSSATFDALSKRSFQFSSRISPGVFVPALEPFTLTLNYQDDGNRYLKSNGTSAALFTSLFSSLNGSETMSTSTRVYEGKVEWRPVSEITSITDLRLTEGMLSLLDSRSKNQRREATERIDYRPGSRELYSARFTALESRSFHTTFTRYAPSLWVENRWSAALLTRLTFDAQFDSDWTGLDNIITNSITPGCNVTLTFPDIGFIQRIELRNDLSFRSTIVEYNPNPSASLAASRATQLIFNTFYLDLYPHPTSYLRFQISRQWNLATSTSKAWQSTDASLQITVQL